MPLSRKAIKRLAIVLIAGEVVIIAAGLWAWHTTLQPPRWWRDTPGSPAAAEQLENSVVAALSRVRPAESHAPYRSAPWTLELSQDDANAWLATRLKAWMDNRGHRWPAAVEAVQLDLRPGEVTVGVQLIDDGTRRVVSITGAPEVRDGGLWLHVSGMALGGLPLPRRLVLDELASAVQGPGVAELVDALGGARPVLPDPVILLDAGRVARITGVRAEAGRIVFTCRTEKD